MELTPRRDSAGFTLLEVLFAMVILGVGILSIGLAQISSIKVASKSRSLSQAMFLAQEQLDLFMTMPGADPVFATPVADDPDPNGPIDVNPADADQTTFTRTWTVEPNTPTVGLTRLTVSITWDSASGVTHQIELQGIKRL
jgi:prepilin-type N-terminal cleavage/methylation domain-containing protein